MLVKKLRLSDSDDIDLVKKKGKLLFTPHFSILIYQGENISSSKFGVIASKKLSNSAVVRNEIKRKANRIYLPFQNKLSKNSYLLMLPTKTFYQAEESQLLADIQNVLTPYMKND